MKTYTFVTYDGLRQLHMIDENNKTWLIPKSEGNTDYQEYLEWVAEGNTPEEAE